MERKSIGLELKDFSKEKRTALIAHAVYGNVDRVRDISMKGMFNSSWKRNDSISFYFNHDGTQAPGKVLRTYEDDQKAYTEVKFGNYTLGNDVMEMVDFGGVIKGASFGYETEKKEYINTNNGKVRKLLQVKHIETSLLTVEPANPLAGVIELNKSFDYKQLTQQEEEMIKAIAASDMVVLERLIAIAETKGDGEIYSWFMAQIARRSDYITELKFHLAGDTVRRDQMKCHIETIEKFIRNGKASDECLCKLQYQVDETKQFLSNLDTADTHLINDGSVSEGSKEEFVKQLYLLTLN